MLKSDNLEDVDEYKWHFTYEVDGESVSDIILSLPNDRERAVARVRRYVRVMTEKDDGGKITFQSD